MDNPNDYEPPRFYVDDGPNGRYVIRDRERGEAQVGTSLSTEADALDHAKQLNKVFKG